MILRSIHIRKLRILAACLFLAGNSGVAAVLTTCSMDDGEMVCCAERDQCMTCMVDLGAGSQVFLAPAEGSCSSTQIVGGKSVDDGVLSVEAIVEVSPVLSVGSLLPTDDSINSPFFTIQDVTHTPSAAHSPPLFLLNASSLI